MNGMTARDIHSQLRDAQNRLQELEETDRLTASRDPRNTRWTDAESALRAAQAALDVAVDALTWIDTDVQELAQERPTAAARGTDGLPLDRDAYAATLTEQADPTAPEDGDHVRLTYSDGSTVEGVWQYVPAGNGETPVLVAASGHVHAYVGGQSRRDVLKRNRSPRLVLMGEPESLVVAALLHELAGVYPYERLGRLSQEMAVLIHDRIGV